MGDSVFWYIPLLPWDVKLWLAATYPCAIDFRQSCG